jgi:hypothetical protein
MTRGHQLVAFEIEVGECLGNKTCLIGLAGHSQVEYPRCDAMCFSTASASGHMELSAKRHQRR